MNENERETIKKDVSNLLEFSNKNQKIKMRTFEIVTKNKTYSIEADEYRINFGFMIFLRDDNQDFVFVIPIDNIISVLGNKEEE